MSAGREHNPGPPLRYEDIYIDPFLLCARDLPRDFGARGKQKSRFNENRDFVGDYGFEPQTLCL